MATALHLKKQHLIMMALVIWSFHATALHLQHDIHVGNSRNPTVHLLPDTAEQPGSVKAIQNPAKQAYASCKPYTRWWWFAGIIMNEDIKAQLDWLKLNNFGGVEIAFIYPVKRNPKAPRFAWLGKDWQGAVCYTKQYADSIGLGCDFTFGTLWPFGGTFVSDADRTQLWNQPDFKQPLRLSWTHPDTGNVLNHLDSTAFHRYANVMGKALSPALKGSKSAIFCDSWEVESKFLWTKGFENDFRKRFGYDIRPFMDSIYVADNAGPRYDYMKLISDKVLNEFYAPFTQKAHELGSISRVQCSGAPVDLIRAYSSVDVPETEAMLYEPSYGKIAASAAALSGKPIVSAETFTCMYGFPAKHIRKEQVADLKLVCDAMFANGVNQIVWHGMPFNPINCDTNYFYASVHVGKKGSLTDELPAFNAYMQKVSEKMRFGEPYSDIAVYLPLEDAWIAGEYPKDLQSQWSWAAFELRYEHFDSELRGYHPTWINGDFLDKAVWSKNILLVRNLSFSLLYVDAAHLDYLTLKSIYKLALQGLPVCLKQIPAESGFVKTNDFNTIVQQLQKLPNVSHDFHSFSIPPPLVENDSILSFRCRTDGHNALIFFPNPRVEKIKYPISYGESFQESVIERKIVVHFNGKSHEMNLQFKPYQSLLLKIDENGNVNFEDIQFEPKIPVIERETEGYFKY